MPGFEGFDATLLYSSFAGAAGGCTTFVHGLTMGYYRQDRYPRKLSLEIIGGTTVALFFSLLKPRPGVALRGPGWAASGVGSCWCP
jgi:hypothetical protein